MSFGREAGAALAFGILYFGMLVYMSFMYATKRYKWASRFTILYFHCLIRVASQACGVAFGVLVWSNTDVFVAYLILSAEGYFSLTIAAYYFLKHFEAGYLGFSPLGQDHSEQPKGAWKKRTFDIWTFRPLFMPWSFWAKDRIMIIDSWLIPANAIIIAGASITANLQNSDNVSELSQSEIDNKKTISKVLRTLGQSIFFALTVIWVAFLANTAIKVQRRRGMTSGAKTVLGLFTIVGFMLCTRGMFGILQAAIESLSYTSPSNYDSGGFTDRFVAIEYCLVVVTEFVAAASLNCSYWPARREAELSGVEQQEQGHDMTKLSA